MGVIDFRLRPPVRGYLDMLMYANGPRRDRATRLHGMEPAPSASRQSVDLLLQEMDRAGVTLGIMVGRSTRLYGSVSNDDLKRIATDYPGRFLGIPALDLSDWRAARRQIDEAVTNGFRAIGIEPGAAAEPMLADDRRLYPLYARIEDVGLPVIVMAGGGAGPDLSYTDPVHIDRVAADFPDLRIVVTHGGWPWVHQILHVAYRRPNVYLSPDQYMVNMPGMQDWIAAADGFLADRLIYGSSYPFLPVDACADWFRALPIRPENRQRVMHDNAAKLLGL